MRLSFLMQTALTAALLFGSQVVAQPFGDVLSPSDPLLPITDAEPIIMAGSYISGAPDEDSPARRVDPNTTESPFAGVGSLTLNGAFEATAVPITPRHLLTAGHAVDLNSDGVVDVAPANLQFYVNYGGNSTIVRGISGILLHPDFTGFNKPVLNDDVAILTLINDLPAGVPIYPILKRPMRQGDNLTLVGYGRTGYGNQGFRLPNPTTSVKRVGQNVADLAFLDDEGFSYPEVYVFDFDGPNEADNWLGGPTLGDKTETTLGNGDSGGPAFIMENGQYQLAGINTFIANFLGSSSYAPLFGSAGGGIMTFPLGEWIASQTGIAWSLNTLKLNVQGNLTYLQPGSTVMIDMDVLDLAQRVTAVQAFLSFNSNHFSTAEGDVGVAAGGGIWDQLIYNLHNTVGDLDVAVGVNLQSIGGTQENGTAAVFTLKATGEGETRLVFRPDLVPDPGLIGTTLFSDELNQTILPQKVDSQTIVIDGTLPTVTVTAPNGGECLKGGQSVEISWLASDLHLDPTSARIEYFNGSAWCLLAANQSGNSYTWNQIPNLNTASAIVRCTVSDLAGNQRHDESDLSFTIDSISPTVDSISIVQDDLELAPSGTAIQGAVEVTVSVSDNLSGVVQAPQVNVLFPGDSLLAATYVSEMPAGSFHYTFLVDSSVPNGQAEVQVSNLVDRSGNAGALASATFNVNKNQITGTVGFGTRSAAVYSFDRSVVFVATDASGAALKTWTRTLSFANNAADKAALAVIGPLTDVPSETVALSAKTSWHLRSRQTLSLGENGQGVAIFFLLGGDLNNTNSINVLDYSLMKIAWGSGLKGDINGDGSTGTLDYSLMQSCWFRIGDNQ